MDSQHRHELEENALAKWLEREIEAIKPKLPGILVGVIAVVGGVLGWSAYKDSVQAQKAESWRDYSLALEGVRPNLSVLKQTAEEHPDSAVEEWSLVTWADGRLWNAATLYLRDRAKSEEALTEAEEAYKNLVSAKSGDVVGRANFGLGRVLEMKGDLEAASDQYQKVSGMFAEIAKERADVLATKKAQKSYAWITKVEAAPATEDTVTGPDLGLGTEQETIDPSATLDDLLRQTIDPSEAEQGGRYEEDTKPASDATETPDE